MATFREPRYLLTLFSVRWIESADPEFCFPVAVQTLANRKQWNARDLTILEQGLLVPTHFNICAYKVWRECA